MGAVTLPQPVRHRHVHLAHPSGLIARANARVALAITGAVGTMWCAYAFALLTLIGLPEAIHEGVPGVIRWLSQQFLQLVLLSIILVGQNISAQAGELRSQQTHDTAQAVLSEQRVMHEELCAELQAVRRELT